MNELDIEAIRARGAHTAEDISALCDEVERLRAERENTPLDTTGRLVIRLSTDTVKELKAGMLKIRIYRDANLGEIVIDTEREPPAWWHR